RVTQASDQLGDLVRRQLAAFTGLTALRHLDLHLFSVRQVTCGHTEASGGDLFDLVVGAVAIVTRFVERRILATLAAVGAGATPVHRPRQRLVRFGTERAQ